MGAEACACCRRVGLDRVAFVEITLLVDVLEKVPQSLDVAVFVGDVRIVGIHPVADLLGEIHPLVSIFHDLLAAGAVVLFYGDGLADIFLCDAELLLHAELHGQSVGVPSGLSFNQIASLGLVSADCVLDGTGHDMVYAGHSVCRRRSFVEHEPGLSFAQGKGLLEGVLFTPFIQYVAVAFYKVKLFVLGKTHRPFF